MITSRSFKTVALLVVGASLLGGGVATASTSSTGVSSASSPGSTPTPVQVTNFPATQNVAGSVNVSNLPSTQNVAGTVSVGNFPSTQNVAGTVNVGNLPTTQNVSGSVSVTGGMLGIDPTQNTVKLDPSATVAVSDKTVPVLQWQYSSATSLNIPLNVSAYKTITVDVQLPAALPSGCTVTAAIQDDLKPDNNANGWLIKDAYGTMPPNDYWHQTVEVTSPTTYVSTWDEPYGCATSIPVNVGVYGRPN